MSQSNEADEAGNRRRSSAPAGSPGGAAPPGAGNDSPGSASGTAGSSGGAPAAARAPWPSLGLRAFFLLSYVAILLNAYSFFSPAHTRTFGVMLFSLVVYITYSVIYLAPSVLLTSAAYFLLTKKQRRSGVTQIGLGKRFAILGVAIATTALTQIILFIDNRVYDLFGYHVFNSFVINVITTPGGIQSMGGGQGNYMIAAMVMVGFLLSQVVVGVIATRPALARAASVALSPRRAVIAFLVLTFASIGERLVYGWCAIKSKSEVLVASNSFPLYQPTSIRSMARKMGVKIEKRKKGSIEVSQSTLQYPLVPLRVEPPGKKFNILWLTAESLRADMLTPEIMPATYAFSERAHRFENHYSGGNGTRMGMFSLFYGLYGNYWFPFLAEQRGPVLFDVLKQQNYQMSMYTSAKFTYPEFDKTIFSAIAPSDLHEARTGVGWQSDRKNVDNMISWMRARDKARPFMMFMFFESPHAAYFFPEESVIRRPYLEEVNYASGNIKRDIELIRNRYINSVHHLDQQIARLLEELKAQNLLDDTIVLITGDHGEEFMEKGNWGHNSYFTEEQIRAPLVLWIPGTGASQVTRMTSHLDVPATILPRLGVKNPPEDYSLGFDLLGSQVREFTIVADWSKICFIDNEYKASFTYKAGGDAIRNATTRDDKPVADMDEYDKTHAEALVRLVRELTHFLQTEQEKQAAEESRTAEPAAGS